MKISHHRAAFRARLIGLAALFSLLVTAGCGLGMSNADKLDRAQQAYLNSDYRAAMIDAKNVLLDEPDNARAREILGRASVEAGDGAGAEKALRRAVDLGADRKALIIDIGRALLLQRKFEDVLSEVRSDQFTDDASRAIALRLRGAALIGIGQPEQARASFNEALELNDREVDALLGVVRTYVMEQNYMQARETLNHVLRAEESYVPAWLASGVLALSMRDTLRAVADYGNAAELARAAGDPLMEIAALAGAAEAMFALREVETIRPLLTRMQEIAPADTRTLLLLSQLSIVDEDWTQAQTNLLEILRRFPENRFAQMLLGIVHKERGNLAQAEMYLAAVVSADPSNANARQELAEIRLMLNKSREAQQALEPLVAAEGVDVGSLSLAANASMLLGELDQAELLLQRAVAAEPGNVELMLQLAVAYIRSRKVQETRDLLESVDVIQGSANEFQRDQLLAITLMAQGDSAAALEAANTLIERWPARQEGYSLVGSIRMSTGDLDGARDSYVRALEIAPENISVLRNVARLDFAQSNFEAAAARLKFILELQPSDAGSMIALARLAALGEQYQEAIDWLEQARIADDRAFGPRLILASIYNATREFEKAKELANEAINLDDENAAAHHALGLSFIGQSKYVRAADSFAEAVDLQPNEPEYKFNLAKARALGGNRAMAAEILESDIEATMRHLPSSMALASLKADAGDTDGARAIIKKLRNEYPEEALVPALEAELAVKQGDLDLAVQLYDSALAIERLPKHTVRAYQVRFLSGHPDPLAPLLAFVEERPFDNDMRNYLAGAYMRVNDVATANAQYETILAQDPDNLIAANNLAYNYLQSGDERAEELARRAYEIDPASIAVLDTLGWILVTKGNLEEGISLLQEAIRSNGENRDINYHLASGYAAAGREPEAKRILEDILTMEGEFDSRTDAEQLLATLQKQ